MRLSAQAFAVSIALFAATAGWAQSNGSASAAVPNAPDPMSGAIVSNYAKFVIAAPPVSLGLDRFYQKYVDAEGIPITSSARVPDAALLVARDIVVAMLTDRPDLRRQLVKMSARVGIMAIDEVTTDLPEQRDWKKPSLSDARLTPCERKTYAEISKMTDREYWNMRSRGMGGLYTTGAAENILGVPGTRYYGENILVHEFSHAIHAAIRESDKSLAARIDEAFQNAVKRGLWKGSYSIQNVEEYWAEGTQFWFNSNMAFKSGDLTIATSADMETYDPALYNVLAQVYPQSHHIAVDIFYRHPARLASKPVNLNNPC